MKRSSTPYGGSDSLKFPSSEAIHTYDASSRNSFPSSVCRVRFRVQVVAQEQKLASSVLQQSRARPVPFAGSSWCSQQKLDTVRRREPCTKSIIAMLWLNCAMFPNRQSVHQSH